MKLCSCSRGNPQPAATGYDGPMINPWPVVACGAAVAGLLVAEARGSQRGVWLTKPIASLAFLWAALAAGALDSVYGRWIFAGLIFCLAGDLLLPEAELMLTMLNSTSGT